MTEERFARCLNFTLREEGGLTDDPRDPGGRTKNGIIQATLDAARRRFPKLPAKVDELTAEDVSLIYRELFWKAVRGDELPVGIDLLMFDAAVQHNPFHSIQFLQLALGLPADSIFGPKTLAALKAYPGGLLMFEMVARRTYFYMNLDAIDQIYGLGWARRILRVYAAALGDAGVDNGRD